MRIQRVAFGVNLAAYLGSYGNAANTAVFPLAVIAFAIAVMVGDGCCASVSLSLGKSKPEDVGRSVGDSILLTAAFSFVLCAVYLIWDSQIIAMFEGTVNDETFAGLFFFCNIFLHHQ